MCFINSTKVNFHWFYEVLFAVAILPSHTFKKIKAAAPWSVQHLLFSHQHSLHTEHFFVFPAAFCRHNPDPDISTPVQCFSVSSTTCRISPSYRTYPQNCNRKQKQNVGLTRSSLCYFLSVWVTISLLFFLIKENVVWLLFEWIFQTSVRLQVVA